MGTKKPNNKTMKQVIKYATGRNSERFTDFDKAKEYAQGIS